MVTIKIEVTQADIANAIAARKNEWVTECCPVAQALRRMFPGRYINVAFHHLWIADREYLAVRPAEMDAFTIPHCHEWPQLQPGSFEVTDSYATQG